MSWRNKSQITGQNMVPLGATRKWGGGGDGEGNEPSSSSSSYGPGPSYGDNGNFHRPSGGYGANPVAGAKRDREDFSVPRAGGSNGNDAAAPRKRRSRWGEEKTDLNVTTALGANVSETEVERYALNVRIEEIARKLQSNDVVPPERERSPSPAPTYDAQGRRTNTREVRYRKKLEEERVRLVDKQIKLDPNYKPPAEYAAAKRNMKPSEKVYLPIREFPEIKFFGLLVGPRGNTQKKMERESGARFSIRGRGSLKEGKGRAGEEEDEEEMHCVVTADDPEKIRKCIQLINQVIETAASTPETQNDHKRNQLRELAALNGTLRDDENQVCQNCGQKGHRKYDCPEQRNWTAHIICHRCGQQGHLARDCTQGRTQGGPGGFAGAPSGPRNGDPFNSEYESLMAELGEGGRPGAGQPPFESASGNGQPGMNMMSGNGTDRPIGPDGKKIPPWRDPNVWNTPSSSGGPPRGPRMGYGGGGGGGGNGRMGSDQYSNQNYGQQRYQNQYHQQNQQQHWQNDQAGVAGYDHNGWQGQQQQQQQQPQEQAQQQQQQGGQGEQPDYREAWEAYYRQQGMDPEAAMAAAATAVSGEVGAQSQQAGKAGQDQQQQDYSKEWEEYYRQQAAGGGQYN